MPVADHKTYVKMLENAYDNHFAYPAINISSMITANAVLKGFAEKKSDGIIQVSTGGGEFASGLGVKNAADGAIALGHRRLSIIGLGDGHQPMCTDDESIWVIYNGELYNHPEIRKELEGKGHVYRTSSDTESFLHLYRDRGLDFLESARGMFSLALWDRPNRRLILARDRTGIKPLFYFHEPGVGIRFASEIKSLLKHPIIKREIEKRCSYAWGAGFGWAELAGRR